MDKEVAKAGDSGEVEKHPLTVSKSAKELSTPSFSCTKSLPVDSDHVTSKDPSSSSAGRSRFYFESDTLALKNNPDYCQLLKTLAILEAQKMQAIRDMEMLLHAQAKADKDPLGFVEALKKGTLDPLPKRQEVAKLPEIEWKLYIDSLQQVAKQHSALYLNTRRQSKPLIASLDEKISVPKPVKNPNKPASFGQQWSVEEQAKFEELLKIYPPEPVERRRFQKIAKALGTRTTQQVATHVQKYFIKLASAGLPVPGRMPNLKSSKKKGKGKRNLKRPSTFFSSLTPHVLMKEEPVSTPTTSEASTYDSSDEDSISAELALGEGVAEDEELTAWSTQVPQAIKCLHCDGEVQHGVYWQCSECPQTTPTHLCNSCINSDYRSQCHSPSHNMQLLSLAPPHAYIGRDEAEDTPTSFVDQDYTNLASQGSQTGYNYLDPNFYPAS